MTSQADPRPRRAPALPPEARRAAIIAAAIPLLREHSTGATTRQIAAAAGIAEGTIFRVFPSKQALIDAVIEKVFDLSDTITAIGAIDPALPLPQRIRAGAAILTNRLRAVFELMVALHRRGPDSPNAPQLTRGRGRHKFHDPSYAQMFAALATIFEPDAARLAVTPQRAAQTLQALAFASSHPHGEGIAPLTPDEITDIVLHGVTKPES